MLDLATLKATLQPIRSIGEVEERFKIDNIEVCMRVLNPKEELEVQRWAQAPVLSATEDARENDNSLAVEYLNRFKLGCLARSIVEINGVDLRNEEYVTTGEILSNGQPVKVPKYTAIVEILECWPRPLLGSVFRKFNEIMERCEINSDNAIEYNSPNIEAEIQRVLQRLAKLEEMRDGKENAKAAAGDYVTDKRDVKTDVDKTTEPTNTENQAPTTNKSGERQSVLPNSGAPMSSEPLDLPEPDPEVLRNDVVVTASGNVGTKAAEDGWIDRGDSDAIGAAVAAETARIQEMRSRRQVQPTPPKTQEPIETVQTKEVGAEPESSETSVNPRFTPPQKR